jgi:hypothetical protein
MSSEPSTLEKSVEEILVELMAERVMSVGIHASSTRGLQASPSTRCHSSRAIEKWSKHYDDLDNAKHIPSVFLEYISCLASTVNCNCIPRDFEYTLIIVYIPKGIHVVGNQLGQIPTLKNNNFNLRNRKNYAMLTPHRYLMRITRKKLCIVSHPWIKELVQSTILNVMKIPHFGRH